MITVTSVSGNPIDEIRPEVEIKQDHTLTLLGMNIPSSVLSKLPSITVALSPDHALLFVLTLPFPSVL